MRSVLPGVLVGVLAALLPAVRAQGTSLVQVGSIAGPADSVDVQGDYAYIAAGKTLTIVDVRDVARPIRVGSYDFPELIWGVTLAGDAAYVAVDTAGLSVLDISRPSAPALRASVKTPGQAKSVAVTANLAFVADHIRGIDVVKLDTSPAIVGDRFVDGFAKDVVTRGNVLYAIDQPNGFNVFDVTKPALAQLGSLTLLTPIPLRAQLDVSEETTPRLAVVVGGGPVQIYDVSNPTAPKAVIVYRTPGNAQRVQLKGRDLYVADGPAGLEIVSLAVPTLPKITATYQTPMPARDVAVAGSLVFVVSGDGVVILRRAE